MAGDGPNSLAGIQEPPRDVFARVAERSCYNVEFLCGTHGRADSFLATIYSALFPFVIRTELTREIYVLRMNPVATTETTKPMVADSIWPLIVKIAACFALASGWRSRARARGTRNNVTLQKAVQKRAR